MSTWRQRPSKAEQATKALTFVLAVCNLMGCPIGCPKPKPQSVFLAGPEVVPSRSSGPCSVRFLEDLGELRFPGSADGFYAVEVDGLTQLAETFEYDASSRELTIRDRWCRGSISIVVQRYRWIRTVGQ